MQKFKFKDLLPALILALICGICVFLLAGTYSITRSKIEEQEEASAQERKLTIFPEAASFEELEFSSEIKSELTAKGILPDEVFSAKGKDGSVMAWRLSGNYLYIYDVKVEVRAILPLKVRLLMICEE